MKQWWFRQKKNQLVLLSLSLAVFTAWHLLSEQQDSLDLSSRSAKRSTKLGQAQQVRGSMDKETSIWNADPALSKKWGLKLTDSAKAWQKHKALGSRDIVVAVIDTGIDSKHPDLKNNLWKNPGETGKDKNGRDKATNGIDDDKNGYIDDVHGWNFAGNNQQLADNHGHGTHIAGIIGAEGGNGIGVSGVSPRVSLMVLKYYDPKAPGHNNLMNTVRAINYAVQMKAHIINYSGGGLEKSSVEYKAVQKAQRKGILFVAAAGNERSNSDVRGYYPADYNLDNIISVTAIDSKKSVLPTSNYGRLSVDIAAPGHDILSTLPQGQYGKMTGTSQATAFVSGVAALLMSQFRDFDAKRVIKHLTQTGDLDQRLANKTRYKKRLNAYRALAILDNGVGLTGVVARNTTNIKKEAFASDLGASQLDPTSFFIRQPADDVASLSQAMKAILTKSQKPQQKKEPVADTHSNL